MTEEKCIPIDQLPKAAQDCIESILNKEGFTNPILKCYTFSTQGANFMSALYEVDIKGTTKEAEKELNLFIKSAIPIGEYISEAVTSNEAYIREGHVYKELFKSFATIQEEANVPTEERYRTLKGYDESTADIMIMENLSKKGYRICERKQTVPLRFAELAVQQLAKLHSLGFALKKCMPEYYKEFIEVHSQPPKITEKFVTFVENMAKSTLNSLTGDYIKKAESFIPKCMQNFSKYIKADADTISTICHFDYRPDNILAKESNGEIIDVVPVDYQSMTLGCPVNDFMYFITMATDRKFRIQNLDRLIELYYDAMKNFLQYFNIDVFEVYPREVFDKAMEDRKDFSLTLALPFFLMLYAPENNIPTLDSNIDELNIILERNIVERLEEFIDEVKEAGLL